MVALWSLLNMTYTTSKKEGPDCNGTGKELLPWSRVPWIAQPTCGRCGGLGVIEVQTLTRDDNVTTAGTADIWST
jgi:hypothetical protein